VTSEIITTTSDYQTSETTTTSVITSESTIRTTEGEVTGEITTTLTTSSEQTNPTTTTLEITNELTTTKQQQEETTTTTTTTLEVTNEITTTIQQTESTTFGKTDEITPTSEETPLTTTTLAVTNEITTTNEEETSEVTTTLGVTQEITTTKQQETSTDTTALGLTDEITTTKQSETSAETTTVGITNDMTTTSQDQTTETTTPIPICKAVQSGDFDDPETWENEQVPSGSCSIVIPTDITVTFSRILFDIEVPTITISGSLIFSSTFNITFQYVIHIIIEAGGSFEDQTSQHTIYVLAGSLFTFYSGSSFIGSQTIVYTYTFVSGTITVGESYTFGSSISGPFTFGILLTGEIQIFYSITFIVLQSGSFTDSLTWLGGIVPTADFCSKVDGCGLYISPQCVLSTESLNGELNIYFFQITIAFGATFQLGSTSVSTDFRFFYTFSFNISGTLQFLPESGGSIYLPFGSSFYFLFEAQFISSITIDLRTYGESIDIYIFILSLDSLFQGPYFILISLDGDITQTSEGNENKYILFYILELFNFDFRGNITSSNTKYRWSTYRRIDFT